MGELRKHELDHSWYECPFCTLERVLNAELNGGKFEKNEARLLLDFLPNWEWLRNQEFKELRITLKKCAA